MSSGKNYFSLINIKENRIQPFIYSGTTLSSNGFFFVERKFGYSLNFVADSQDAENEQYGWYEM